MKRGKMIYAPAHFLDLMELVKKEKGIQSNITVFEEIKNYTLIGREVEKINFLGKIPKKKGGFF